MRILLCLSLLLAGPVSHTAEQTLGRLFYTPAQRAQLDSLRQQPAAVDRDEPPIFTIDGEVRRSSGHDSHWRNGEIQRSPLDKNQRSSIGERIDRRTGETHKLLGSGQLQIHQPAP